MRPVSVNVNSLTGPYVSSFDSINLTLQCGGWRCATAARREILQAPAWDAISQPIIEPLINDSTACTPSTTRANETGDCCSCHANTAIAEHSRAPERTIPSRTVSYHRTSSLRRTNLRNRQNGGRRDEEEADAAAQQSMDLWQSCTFLPSQRVVRGCGRAGVRTKLHMKGGFD
jgi:hypothetical protein